MNFGEALQALKEGKKIARSVWGGYWFLAHDTPTLQGSNLNPTHLIEEMIVAALKDNKGCAPAMPYQEDILAEDWLIIEEKTQPIIWNGDASLANEVIGESYGVDWDYGEDNSLLILKHRITVPIGSPIPNI